jgi:hypothetical protein
MDHKDVWELSHGRVGGADMACRKIGSRLDGNRWEADDLIFLGDRDVRS